MKLLKFTLRNNQIDPFRIFDAQYCNMPSFVCYVNYTLYFLKVSLSRYFNFFDCCLDICI